MHCYRKEMNCSGYFHILHEIVRDTKRISSCFADFRVVSRTISCSTYVKSQATLNFLSNGAFLFRPKHCQQLKQSTKSAPLLRIYSCTVKRANKILNVCSKSLQRFGNKVHVLSPLKLGSFQTCMSVKLLVFRS